MLTPFKLPSGPFVGKSFLSKALFCVKFSCISLFCHFGRCCITLVTNVPRIGDGRDFRYENPSKRRKLKRTLKTVERERSPRLPPNLCWVFVVFNRQVEHTVASSISSFKLI